jgi:hypothetical protein
MITRREDPRFPVQHVTRAEWERATSVNLAADFLTGHGAIVQRFLGNRREAGFRAVAELLARGNRDDISAFVEAGKGESLAFLVMMMTGACNADCPICFTDRRRRPNELEPQVRDRVLREARELGARFVYIPGEGEPTIDRGFWQLLETCRASGLHAVIFTNGIVLSDPATCRKYWGMEPDEAVDRLVAFPVSFYHKLWSTRPALVADMMQVRPDIYRYASYHGTPIPGGLIRLLERWPRERVGIEVVVERRNADEVVETLVPFAETHGLARIIEMIQHNGRVLGIGEYDPTEQQARAVRASLSPTSCTMATCKAVVTSRGYLSPRIAVLEHQIPGTPGDVREAPLFDLLHGTAPIVERRYEIHTCLCETLPLAQSGCGAGARVRQALNIVPLTLRRERAEADGAGVT